MTGKYRLYTGPCLKDIFSLLASRFECDVIDESVRKAIFLKPLKEDKTSGLAGLDYSMVEVLLHRKPNISLAKAAARYE